MSDRHKQFAEQLLARDLITGLFGACPLHIPVVDFDNDSRDLEMEERFEKILRHIMEPNEKRKRTLRLAIVVALLKLWGFRGCKACIGLGYIVIIAEGLAMVVPALGIKLYRMPFLGSLREYEGWHNLDLALPAAALLFLLSSSIWCTLLEVWMYDRSTEQVIGLRSDRYEQCMFVVGGIILFADACLFYRAMTFVGWNGDLVSPSALLSTLGYVAVLVAMCVNSVNLKRKYLSLKRGEPQGDQP